MSRTRWLRGVLWLTGGNVVSTVLSAAGAVVVARILGPASFGTYSVVVVFVGFGATLASFRLEMHLITSLHKSPGDVQVAQDVLRSAWLLTVAVVSLGAAAVLVLNVAAPVVIAITAAEVLLSPLILGRAVLQAHARQRALVASSVAGRMVWLALVTAVALAGPADALVLILGARVLSLAAEMAFVWGLAGIPVIPTLAPRSLSPRRHAATLAASAPLAAAGLAGTAYNRADQLILAALRGRHETGLYAAGVRVAEFLGTLGPIVDNVTLPALVELNRRGDETEFVRAVRDSTLLMTVPTGVVVSVLLAAGSDVVPLLFGADYVAVGPIIGLLAAAEWVTLLGSIGASTALARGERGVLLRSTMVGLAVNLVANVALIPPFGGAGAAWAAMAGYGVASLYAYAVPSIRAPLRAAASAAIRVLVAMMAAWAAGALPLPLGLRIVALATTYSSVLVTLLPNDFRRVARWARMKLPLKRTAPDG